MKNLSCPKSFSPLKSISKNTLSISNNNIGVIASIKISVLSLGREFKKSLSYLSSSRSNFLDNALLLGSKAHVYYEFAQLLWNIAFLKIPLPIGDIEWYETLHAGAFSPKLVILSGSPLNLLIFYLTRLSVATSYQLFQALLQYSNKSRSSNI